ncbi:unnamed protein product [Schistosoma rodhaini]|uniref:Enhancer of polycomb homolog n=1 Tax=Schistosoma mansoni TaxID=6183 RepID=G4V7Z5_SCHMA|nr:hypothetical protein Smp_035290 [Schistosoma mansoni]CAH8443569.1 unnamed protein product [Schistosoma rodhaini]|eukprot:XP_018647877.1 hypothetical protein Smp_035290 [Schistosoma mansoni]
MKWSIPAALLEEQTRTSLNKECNKHTVKTGDNLQANSTVVEANKTMQKKEDLVKCMETLDDSLMILGERIGKKKSNSKENLTQKNMTSTSSYDFDSKDPISTIMSPKAERYVRRWLTDASPLERTTALELIDKLYREANEQDQLTDTQFQDVMKRVKNINWDQNKTSHPVFSRSDGSTHFKYLDLLSQQERRNHWMYCSWHHLPPYKISSTAKYDYPGSHYLHLLERQPKEYVIHPDLG